MSDDTVKEEPSCSIGCVVKRGHSFIPFGEVFDYDYDVFVPITGWGLACHEINIPFEKGAYGDNMMKAGWWCSGFMLI
jgi:hypothetical protein